MRWPIILLLVLGIGGGRPAGAAPIPATLAQIPAVTPTGQLTTVHAGPGDQIDPHISGALVSYTDDTGPVQQVRFFNLLTNTGGAVPTNGLAFLSDVNSNRIVYTNVTAAGSQIGVFDVSTGTAATIPDGTQRTQASLGGSTVGFEDRRFSANPLESEIAIFDLATTTTTRLTSDALQDLDPTVSPDGNVIVWTKCLPMNVLQGCDIYQATRTGGSWATTQRTGPEGEESRPAATNGQVVVYQSTRGGEKDIYYRPVAGGTETQLALPGEQRNPSIAGPFIAFESNHAAANFDLFVHDIATNTLYRLPPTPVDETLNDISVHDGLIRVVWSAPGTGGDFDVFAFTFQPAPLAGTVPLSLTASQLQVFPGGAEKVQAQGVFTLGAASNGIDPAAERVSIRLLRAGAVSYPTSAGVMPVTLAPTATGWAITEAEKTRTNIQALEIGRTADPRKFTFRLADTRTSVPPADYSRVRLEIEIGNDQGGADVTLVNRNGNWSL